jgi:hypothetical protein
VLTLGFAVKECPRFVPKTKRATAPAGDVGISSRKRSLWDAAGAVLQGPHAREEMPQKNRRVNRRDFFRASIRAPSH